jgi:hypothetical protein
MQESNESYTYPASLQESSIVVMDLHLSPPTTMHMEMHAAQQQRHSISQCLPHVCLT